MKLRQTKYVIGIAFILVGVGIVVATTLPKSMQYYVTVDELFAKESKYLGKELKVAGKVKQGSIQKSEKDISWKFEVENGGQTMNVAYRGAMPDTFKEGADVVITGTLGEGREMVATNVLAKCASRYEEKLKPSYDTKRTN